MIRSTSLAAAVLLLCTVLSLLSSCDRSQEREPVHTSQSIALPYSESVPEEGARLLYLVDSLEQAGGISEVAANYNRGVAYDMMKRGQVAEMYFRRAYEAYNPESDGWEDYFTVANGLTTMRMAAGDFEGSLVVASEVLDRAEKAGELTDERKINILWNISKCQKGLGMIEDWEQMSALVYDFLRTQVRESGRQTSEDLLIFTSSMASSYVKLEEYAKAAYWQTRSEEELSLYEAAPKHHEVLKEYTWRIALSKVFINSAEGKHHEAEAKFNEVLPLMMETADGMCSAASYLMSEERYAEAADLYDKVDEVLPADNKFALPNLANFRDRLIPRLRANLEAGRTNRVTAIVRRLCDTFEDALNWQKQESAAELATIYATHLKDEEIAAQKAEVSRLRILMLVGVLLLILLFFYIYDRGHRNHIKVLSEEHRKLEEAYGDLALANLRAEESSRMKSHFIQQISHEIRTPLNILSGFSQIMTTNGMELGQEEKDEINRGILENTGRITSLVNKMLDLSDAVSVHDVLPDEFVTPEQIAHAAVRESGIKGASHLTFEMAAAEGVSELGMRTNLAQASHALAMLLDNAQKFTHPAVVTKEEEASLKQERATLEVSKLEGRIAFVVEDTGIGIPPSEMERIFEEFVQLDDYYVGMGIGLTVARSLARRLGGDIVLDTSYTGGARFVMTLPIEK